MICHFLTSINLLFRCMYIFILLVHILDAQSPPTQIITKSISSKEVVIITGNFSLNGKLTNIAEYVLDEAE